MLLDDVPPPDRSPEPFRCPGVMSVSGVEQWSVEGRALRIVETTHRPQRLSPAERGRMARELEGRGLTVHDPEALAFPLVQAIHVLPDGHVWVQIRGEALDNASRTLDVFDPEGRFLGTVEAPFRLARLGIPAARGDTLAALVLEELDIPFVVRATIERPTR